MLVLSSDQIIDRINNPVNRGEITQACENEQELKAFCTRKENQDYILDFVKGMVVNAKYEAFQKEYLNATVDIIDQVRKQYKKVNDAQEKNIRFEFDSSVKEIEFSNLRKTLYNGLSDVDFFSESIERALYMPHNILFVIPDSDLEGLPNIKEYNISHVWDLECSVSGIDFICFKKSYQDSDKELYFGADSEKYFSYVMEKGNVVESEEVFFINFEKCPAFWVWNVNIPESLILKKSLLYDSLSYLYDYSVTWNGNNQYKRASAYPTEFRAKAFQKIESKNPPNNSNSNIPYNGADDYVQKTPNAAFLRSEKPKNQTKLGATVELDIFTTATEKLDQYIKAHFRLESDSEILKFHETNIDAQRKLILAQICGEGFGQSSTREAINIKQVQMNFDNQESNLDDFRNYIQKSWKGANDIAAKIFSNTFVESVVFLGDEYFLRTASQLNEELTAMKEAGFPQSDIEEKVKKIRQTQNKHNPSYLNRANILSEIQPFQNFDSNFINQSAQFLQQFQFKDYTLYLNFQLVVSLFEQNNGKVQDYQVDLPYYIRVSQIREEFYKINDEILSNQSIINTSNEAIQNN